MAAIDNHQTGTIVIMSQFLTNDALFEALKTYDQGAQMQLYWKLLPGLAGYADKILHDHELARDVAKDRFWTYMRLIDRMKDYRHLVNALFMAVKHASLKYNEKKKGYHEVDLESVNLEEIPDADTIMEIEKNEVLAFLRLQIALLPGKEKRVAQCAYVEGMTSKEIAQLLNKSVRTIENIRWRIINKLRDAFRSAGFIKLFIFLTFLFSSDYTSKEIFLKKIGIGVSSKVTKPVYNNKTLAYKYH